MLYAGQPIALVVAETFEAARDAAHRLRPVYTELPATTGFDAETAEKPEDSQIAAHASQGDIEAAMADAAVTLDFTYTTPGQNSAAMEPHTTIAQWNGDELTLHCSMQMLKTDRQQLAKALGIDKEKVRLISPYVGGGFGSKLFVSPEMVACSLAAKALGRPIKTVMTRQQVFECTVRRSNTQQRIRLGATMPTASCWRSATTRSPATCRARASSSPAGSPRISFMRASIATSTTTSCT